jgi:hypothetical protein
MDEILHPCPKKVLQFYICGGATECIYARCSNLPSGSQGDRPCRIVIAFELAAHFRAA